MDHCDPDTSDDLISKGSTTPIRLESTLYECVRVYVFVLVYVHTSLYILCVLSGSCRDY